MGRRKSAKEKEQKEAPKEVEQRGDAKGSAEFKNDEELWQTSEPTSKKKPDDGRAGKNHRAAFLGWTPGKKEGAMTGFAKDCVTGVNVLVYQSDFEKLYQEYALYLRPSGDELAYNTIPNPAGDPSHQAVEVMILCPMNIMKERKKAKEAPVTPLPLNGASGPPPVRRQPSSQPPASYPARLREEQLFPSEADVERLQLVQERAALQETNAALQEQLRAVHQARTTETAQVDTLNDGAFKDLLALLMKVRKERVEEFEDNETMRAVKMLSDRLKRLYGPYLKGLCSGLQYAYAEQLPRLFNYVETVYETHCNESIQAETGLYRLRSISQHVRQVAGQYMSRLQLIAALREGCPQLLKDLQACVNNLGIVFVMEEDSLDKLKLPP